MRKLVVLPAPLGPSNPDDLSGIDLEINAVHHPAFSVDLDQPFGFEDRLHAAPHGHVAVFVEGQTVLNTHVRGAPSPGELSGVRGQAVSGVGGLNA